MGYAFDNPALARSITAFKDDHNLQLLVHDPVLQFHELALQAKKLFEINVPVDGVRSLIFAGGFNELGQALIVELHLKLFVEAIQHLGVDASLKGFRRLRILATHGTRVLSNDTMKREDNKHESLRR